MTDAPPPEPLVRSAIDGRAWPLEAFAAEVEGAPAPLRPFDDVAVGFSTALSGALFALPDVKSQPAVVALAYWLRPRQIEEARAAVVAGTGPGILLVPRGRVFHVPPANVDTLFVYGWILALLAGNLNVVRLSERRPPAIENLLGAIRRLLDDPRFSVLARRNWIVHTGHDDRVSARLAALADVRVVWGGDATVRHFRQFAMPVRGRELTFPDRHSLAILGAEAVAAAAEPDLAKLANAFVNDAYWFDQGACGSPRLVLWWDPDGRWAAAARERFHRAVAGALEARGYEAPLGIALEKRTFGFAAAARQDVIAYDEADNRTTWITLATLDAYDRAHCGGGLFFEHVVSDLPGLLERFARSEDQTAAHFGIPADLLLLTATRLNGRGIDRFVPIGQALDFERIWDGYDLLQEFTRRVTVRPAPLT
jgi:hypothetical protein